MASPSVHISRATALCVQCGKAVTPPADGTVRFGIEVDGKFYHKDCFKCSNCQHSLVGQEYLNHAGKPICKNCSSSKILPKCFGCRKPVQGQVTVVFGKTWHDSCVRCSQCNKPINQDGYLDDDTQKLIHLSCQH